MAKPISEGRMIRRDISRSIGFSKLTTESQLLFCLLIPHFNAHGKMNGNVYFIKGEVVPLINKFDIKKIEFCLNEISTHTSVKWFFFNGLHYIHSINWKEHQQLREDKLGTDKLPDYSGTSPVLVPPEVEVEVEVEDIIVFESDSGKIYTIPEFFEALWNVYPRKIGKPDAERHYLKTVKTAEDMAQINKAMGRYLLEVENTEKQFIKHGSAWFCQWRNWTPEATDGE